MRKRTLAALSLAILLGGADLALAADPATRCAALQAPLIQGLAVETVALVPAGAVKIGPEPTASVDLPAHCLFRGTLGATHRGGRTALGHRHRVATAA